jgi:hypothetical protein
MGGNVPKPSDERALLQLLASNQSETGVFFAYWSEIRSQSHTAKFLESIEGAPDLSQQTQVLLKDFVEQGFVQDLANWATKEGRHYAVTFAGKQRLSEQNSKQSFSKTLWSRKGTVSIVISVISAILLVYMWIIDNVDPNYACEMPLSSILVNCVVFLEELGNQ